MSKLRMASVLSLLMTFSAPAFATDAGAPPSPPSFRADFLKALDRVENQTVSLEQAMPQKKFTWRPGKDVRSVSEVYLHIAGSIYFFVTKLGREPPAGVKALGKKDWDTQTTNKEAIKTVLTTAFAFLRTAVQETSDADFDKSVQMFGNEWSERLVFMAVQGHCWEHLGQSIAYARVNGVVPPWSKPDANE
jgi:uncharacterized damage-inducible protein DinB